MKLATLPGDQDGNLVVVSRNLTRAANASTVAPNLQSALNSWSQASPELERIYQSLQGNPISGFPFKEDRALAPLTSMAVAGRIRLRKPWPAHV